MVFKNKDVHSVFSLIFISVRFQKRRTSDKRGPFRARKLHPMQALMMQEETVVSPCWKGS